MFHFVFYYVNIEKINKYHCTVLLIENPVTSERYRSSNFKVKTAGSKIMGGFKALKTM